MGGVGILEYTGKREAAPICGGITGIVIIFLAMFAVLIVSSSTEIPGFVVLAPALLAGVLAIIASIAFVRDSRVYYKRQ
ncbi:MAG: hypothetical protein RTU30_16310 [Candidatus Thorarchaeota archaeon]